MNPTIDQISKDDELLLREILAGYAKSEPVESSASLLRVVRFWKGRKEDK